MILDSAPVSIVLPFTLMYFLPIGIEIEILPFCISATLVLEFHFTLALSFR